MKANWYLLLNRAVEEGVERGYTRAFKYTDKPEITLVKDVIIETVMLEICEIIDFGTSNDSK